MCTVHGGDAVVERYAGDLFVTVANGKLYLKDTLHNGWRTEFNKDHVKALAKADGR